MSIYLAFTPTDIKNLTTTHFKSYLVNDSNYYVHFSYSLKQEDKWVLKAVGELEPNMKLLIEDFTLADLNDMLQGCVQLHSYKKDKPFALKPTCDLQVKIDAVKFYKLNTFHESVFFEQPALIYTLIEKDKPAQHPMFEPLTRKGEDEATDKLRWVMRHQAVCQKKRLIRRRRNSPSVISLSVRSQLNRFLAMTKLS